MKRLLSMACGLSLALIGSGLASATSVTTPGLTVSSGPITFSNFTCDFTGSGTNTGACSTISVTPLTPSPAGIQFASNLNTLGSSSADAALTFNLVSTAGINAVGLDFNSNFFGLQVNSVTEDVYTSLGGTLVGTATVYCGTLTGCAATTVDNIALSGTYKDLYITKDISLAGYSTTSSGSVSIIQQTFTTTATPEPVSVSLIGGGLAVLGLVRLRKRKA